MSTPADLQAQPVIASSVLESLYEHRLLSTRQIHRMHTPDASMRWTRTLLTGLRRRGLVSFVRTTDGGGSVYFLTPMGAETLELSTARTQQSRRKLITPAQATGPLRAHTLAVNETAIAFLLSARERGDEFGTLAWRHEIAHPISPRRGELLIADALLTYLRYGPKGELIFHYRLLELDRATLPTDTLAAKLARYAHLYHYTPAGQQTHGWQSRYPVFPGVICVLAGQSRPVLERRAQTVLALCREDPHLARTPQVELSICLLCDLTTHGPFAAIWQRPDDERRLDWLGHPARDTPHDHAGQRERK